MLRIFAVHRRVRPLLVVLAFAIPIFIIGVFSVAAGRRMALNTARSNTQELIRLASSNHEFLIEESRDLLIIISKLDDIRSPDPRVCSAFMAGLLPDFARYANLGVADPNGDVTCSGVPLTKPVNIADREYFKRAVVSKNFAVGKYQIGRITGKPTLNLGYPILNADGEVQKVVFAALDLAWLSEFLEFSNLPPKTEISVVDSDGVILAHYPADSTLIGKKVDTSLTGTFKKDPKGGTQEVVGKDMVRRFLSFAPLQGSGQAEYVYVNVSVPTDNIIEATNTLFARIMIAMLGLLIVALAFAWFGHKYLTGTTETEIAPRTALREAPSL